MIIDRDQHMEHYEIRKCSGTFMLLWHRSLSPEVDKWVRCQSTGLGGRILVSKLLLFVIVIIIIIAHSHCCHGVIKVKAIFPVKLCECLQYVVLTPSKVLISEQALFI